MRTKLLRLAVVAATVAALGRMGVSPTRAQSSSGGSSSTEKEQKSGCCGRQAEAPEPKCAAGAKYDAASNVCVGADGKQAPPTYDK